MKVGLVDMSTHGGKIKFEFLEHASKIFLIFEMGRTAEILE